MLRPIENQTNKNLVFWFLDLKLSLSIRHLSTNIQYIYINLYNGNKIGARETINSTTMMISLLKLTLTLTLTRGAQRFKQSEGAPIL